jgi:L-fuculose-phosphate aldolase
MKSMNELLSLAHTVSPFTICGEGNVSQKVGDNFWIKASGTDLHTLSEEDLTLCDMNGNQLDPSHKKASIESSFHAWLLSFGGINFISHTHPVHTVKIVCTEWIYEFADHRLFPDQIVRNGTKSCVVPFAPPGKSALEAVKSGMNKFLDKEGYVPNLILLQNHGIISLSSTAKDCAASTLMCEKSAEIYVGCKQLGQIYFLNKDQVGLVDNCPNEQYRRDMYQ